MDTTKHVQDQLVFLYVKIELYSQDYWTYFSSYFTNKLTICLFNLEIFLQAHINHSSPSQYASTIHTF